MSSRKRKEAEPETAKTQSFTDLDAITAGMEHLRVSDARLVPLIESFGAPERLLAKDSSCFRSLAKSIIYQQLAGSAAAAIYARFLTACGVPDESHLTPEAVLGAPLPSLRGCGLSERKASYLVDLAAHFQDGRLSDHLLTSVSDAELLQRLTAVRGIGPWTVDMFAMFHLGHPNILPVGDLGVRKGLAHLCGLKHLPSPDEMHELTTAWQPYRSLGCYYMWRIPLPPAAARQGSKAKGNGSKAKGKATSTSNGSLYGCQEPYRAPAPAFPLGGAVPAVADVGVNPAAPVQAAPHASQVTAAAAAAAAAAVAGGGAPVAAAVAAAAAAGTCAEEVAAQATPAKPLAPPRLTQRSVQQPSSADAVAASAEHLGATGVMTRRQLKWAQQQAAAPPAGAVTQRVPTAAHTGELKARIVDL